MRVQSLGWEDPLEEGMATHSSVLTRRISWPERSLVGYSPWGWTESDTGELRRLSTHTLLADQQCDGFRCTAEGISCTYTYIPSSPKFPSHPGSGGRALIKWLSLQLSSKYWHNHHFVFYCFWAQCTFLSLSQVRHIALFLFSPAVS